MPYPSLMGLATGMGCDEPGGINSLVSTYHFMPLVLGTMSFRDEHQTSMVQPEHLSGYQCSNMQKWVRDLQSRCPHTRLNLRIRRKREK